MATAKQPGGQRGGGREGPRPAAPGSSGWSSAWPSCAAWASAWSTAAAAGDDVLPPTSQERGDTVPILQRSSASQGICYGWVLPGLLRVHGPQRRLEPRRGGGGRGELGLPALGAGGRPGRVHLGEQREQRLRPHHGGSLRRRLRHRPAADGERAGAARAEPRTPLSTSPAGRSPGPPSRCRCSPPEAGLVEPAATPAAATADAPPLPDAGSDLWRDRWGYLLAAVGLLLFTALLFAAGFWQRGRQRREEAQRQAQAGAGCGTHRAAAPVRRRAGDRRRAGTARAVAAGPRGGARRGLRLRRLRAGLRAGPGRPRQLPDRRHRRAGVDRARRDGLRDGRRLARSPSRCSPGPPPRSP